MNEYPVPNYPDYFVREDGTIVSYKRDKQGRALTVYKKKSKNQRVLPQVCLVQSPDDADYRPQNGKTITHYKVVAAAKYGRWPEPHEEVRHMDGDHTNNSMSNLQLGDHLNNVIDDIERGDRQTSVEQLDLAIARLMSIREKLE